MQNGVDSRREAILDAAADLISERGFEAMTVRELARAVGLSQGALYYHIGSKSELLADLARSYVDDEIAKLVAIRNSGDTPDDKVRHIIRTVIETVVTNRNKMSVFLHERRSLSPEHRAEMNAKSLVIRRTVQEILEEGQALGYWRDIPLKSVRMAIFGMVSWALEWLDPNGPTSADEFAEHFSDLVLHGMTKREC